MARWERDPQARSRMRWLLTLGEVTAVTANFFVISLHYFRWMIMRVAPQGGTEIGPFTMPAIATAAVAIFLVFQGIAYGRERPWGRRLFLIENVALIVLGLVWFLVKLSEPEEARGLSVLGGLLLPMVTLFPLLWPLWTFWAHPPPASPTR